MAELIARCDIFFRITGKQSIERLEPLISQVVNDRTICGICNAIAMKDDELRYPPLFVWETTCRKEWREQHRGALVLNKLHNTHIFESKSALAFLQLRMKSPILETFIANSSEEVSRWLSHKWSHTGRDSNLEEQAAYRVKNGSDWWVIKASSGNGGRDVWIASPDNSKEVLADLHARQEYVVQKFVTDPILYQGKKFHFRCYTMLWADGTAMIYQMAYILCAGFQYDCENQDVRKHVTNLSINKRITGYPGQVPCHLPTAYSALYTSIQSLWQDLVAASEPFMSKQQNYLNFEFFGIDVIADSSGACWLIEVNRLPGLESSTLNKAAEDIMYDDMMLSLLRMVLKPVLPPPGATQNTSAAVDIPNAVNPSPSIPHGLSVNEVGMWDLVSTRYSSLASSPVPPLQQGASDETWLNLLNWKAFTKKNRSRVLTENNL